MASNSDWSMDEWFADCYVPRNEMNQLIMDYLITGTNFSLMKVSKISEVFGFQRDIKRLLKNLRKNLESEMTVRWKKVWRIGFE